MQDMYDVVVDQAQCQDKRAVDSEELNEFNDDKKWRSRCDTHDPRAKLQDRADYSGSSQ